METQRFLPILSCISRLYFRPTRRLRMAKVKEVKKMPNDPITWVILITIGIISLAVGYLSKH